MVVSSLKRCVLRTAAAAMSAVVVGRQTADGPTDIGFGRTERQQQQPLAYMYLLLHTFDAVCLLYAQICVEMHTSLCTPISWDLMLDPCEWFSKSLSRRLKPQLTSLLGVRVCSTYCVCVTVVSQLTKSIKIYILIYISLVCTYIYVGSEDLKYLQPCWSNRGRDQKWRHHRRPKCIWVRQ